MTVLSENINFSVCFLKPFFFLIFCKHKLQNYDFFFFFKAAAW